MYHSFQYFLKKQIEIKTRVDFIAMSQHILKQWEKLYTIKQEEYQPDIFVVSWNWASNK